MFLFTVIWGTSFPLTKNVLADVPVFSFLSLRFSAGAILLLAIFHKRLLTARLADIRAGFVLGLIFFFSLFFQVASLKYTSSSNSAFISALAVVIVPLISLCVLRQSASPKLWVSVGLSLLGLFLITGGIHFQVGPGEGLALLSASFSALQIIFIDRYARQHDSSVLGVLQILFCAVAYSLVAGGVGYGSFTFSGGLWLAVIMTGVFGTAVAYTGQIYAQKYTSPTSIALIITTEPVFALIFALLIPDANHITESVSLLKGLGCVAILAATLIAELSPAVIVSAFRRFMPGQTRTKLDGPAQP